MSIRPVPARWFEMLITREDLVKAVDVLARTGDVELETHSEATQRATMPDLRDRFEEYNRLLRRYQAYWPRKDLRPSAAPGQPAQRLDHALSQLNAWQKDSEAQILQLEQLQNEQSELALLQDLLNNLENETLDFGLISHAGPALNARLFILPITAHIAQLPPSVLSVRARSKACLFLLAVGPAINMETLQRDMILQKGRSVEIPPWLSGNRSQVMQQVQQRQQDNTQRITELQQQIEQLNQRHQLQEALGDIQQLEWFIAHVSDLPVTENFAWITGWTRDVEGNLLNEVMNKAAINAVVHFPAAPIGMTPPMVLHNPSWSRPFEFFARLLGMPSQDEFDPSTILTLMVPILFGYMFGDAGQGVILIIGGLWLSRRWPIFKVLAGCGIASVGFGVVFGSVFGMEHIIEPVWVNPIEQPLTVLLVPLAGGIVILLLGLCLNGVQAFWRGEIKNWALVEAAVIAIYLGIIGGLLRGVLALLIPLGLAWYFGGSIFLNRTQIMKTLGLATGQLLESVFQLLINTISFIRVGAFALAHAGLSLAVIILSESTDNVLLAAVVILLGNIVIIILEGLVVSIQTTRLILFEFFIRFLQGTGRLFRPLLAPAESGQESNGRST